LQSDGGQAVLAQPEKILSFILHVLEVNEPQSYPNTKAKTSGGLRMEDLRIVEDEEDVDNPAISGADSDDEDEEQADLPSDLTSTALNLLLSILEGMLFASFQPSLQLMVNTSTPRYINPHLTDLG
jgi:hypothetical protein